MSELYEVVQYAGNIVPRLYLLVTVGSVYIKTKEAPAKDVLRDLVEMCRGVQHPTRGLFLRNYLSEVTKDKLPDIGSEYSDEGGMVGGGDVKDSVHFILQNFTEMNKLWVRMQRQGPVKNRNKREDERRDLRLLVGKNLARLSQLDGVDVQLYQEAVLPKVLDQIVKCDDQIAQQYLIEILISVFPETYHYPTLELLLKAVSKLQGTVNIREIFERLIERLKPLLTGLDHSQPQEIDVFELFFSTAKLVATPSEQHNYKLSQTDVLSLYSKLLEELVFGVYPNHTPYINRIFDAVYDHLVSWAASEPATASNDTLSKLYALLKIALDKQHNVVATLATAHYIDIVNTHLNASSQKRIADEILKSALAHQTIIPTVQDVERLFACIKPLLRDEEGSASDEEDPDDFAQDQNRVAAVVHLFVNPSAEVIYGILTNVRKEFGLGGTKRIKHTLPPLVFKSLQLVPLLKQMTAGNPEQWGNVGKKIFKFVNETVTVLERTDHKELAMRLFLQCAECASNVGFETIAYEFITKVFEIYENDIVDSKQQFRAINEIVGTLYGLLRVFGEENYDTLITKAYVHATKLLKKHDQCRAVYMCAHLFWGEVKGENGGEDKEWKNGKKVLALLQKSLRIAEPTMDSSLNVSLYVEILNEYLYFFEHKNDAVQVKYLSGLISLIRKNLEGMEGIEDSSSDPVVAEEAGLTRLFFENTLEHIVRKQKQGAPGYSEIEL
eukprot:TRINITY_DN673_c0_g1_i1.p1 TRINITY_DN673_c0_g1~~TRINITY_DN673_c0_g1_i1.p1  ORF type:complete len:837 (+),score=226.35 TRINITY_DN673_c0_g1_i1:338-2512(+)